MWHILTSWWGNAVTLHWRPVFSWVVITIFNLLCLLSEMEASVVVSVSPKQQWSRSLGDPGYGRYNAFNTHLSHWALVVTWLHWSQTGKQTLTITKILKGHSCDFRQEVQFISYWSCTFLTFLINLTTRALQILTTQPNRATHCQ